MFGLIEINLYPYLNVAFYIFFAYLIFKFKSDKEKLFYIFIISLILESAFIIKVGFFVKVSHITGILLIFIAARFSFKLPAKYILLLSLFFIIAVLSIIVNFDLAGLATINSSRANFMRPAIQLMQFSILSLIMCSVITVIKRYNIFKETMHIMHCLSVIVAFYAIYEIASCAFHLPFLNLNNDLPSYWYLGISSDFPIFRPRSIFYEPINLNNFQFFGIACSLIYKELYNKKGIKYWGLFIVQVAVLILSFSRSTLLVVPVVTIIFVLFYPQQKGEAAFNFLFKKSLKLISIFSLIIALLSFFINGYSGVKEENLLSKICFGRFQNLFQELSIIGRSNAINELKHLYTDDRILLGIGMGNEFNWLDTERNEQRASVSSFYNQIFIYTGVIGFTFFMLFLLFILLSLFYNCLDRRNNFFNRKISLIFFTGLLAMLVQRLSFAGFLTDTYLWAAFAIGIYIEQNFRPPYETSGGNISCGFQERASQVL